MREVEEEAEAWAVQEEEQVQQVGQEEEQQQVAPASPARSDADSSYASSQSRKNEQLMAMMNRARMDWESSKGGGSGGQQ